MSFRPVVCQCGTRLGVVEEELVFKAGKMGVKGTFIAERTLQLVGRDAACCPSCNKVVSLKAPKR